MKYSVSVAKLARCEKKEELKKKKEELKQPIRIIVVLFFLV